MDWKLGWVPVVKIDPNNYGETGVWKGIKNWGLKEHYYQKVLFYLKVSVCDYGDPYSFLADLTHYPDLYAYCLNYYGWLTIEGKNLDVLNCWGIVGMKMIPKKYIKWEKPVCYSCLI